MENTNEVTLEMLQKQVDVLTKNESVDKIEVFGLLNLGDSVIIRATDEIK